MLAYRILVGAGRLRACSCGFNRPTDSSIEYFVRVVGGENRKVRAHSIFTPKAVSTADSSIVKEIFNPNLSLFANSLRIPRPH